MQRILLVSTLFLFGVYKGMSEGVNFEHGLNWEQVRAKAKIERKYIFVDCFATWCGPCKQMDQEVYPIKEVGRYINDHFISVKVQLDSTRADDQEVKNWYADARAIMSEYHVNEFPTFLFFSPDGKLVHKEIGFMIAADFVKLLEQAIDTNFQYYTILDAFYRGKIDYLQMPLLIENLERIGEKKAAMDMASYYIDNYLLRSNDDLYSKRNIRFIGFHIVNSESRAFVWFYNHSDSVDYIAGKGFARSVIDRVIARELIAPYLAKWDGVDIGAIKKSDWMRLRNDIKRKYNSDFADRNIVNAQIRWYTRKHQWKEAVHFNMKKIEMFGLDTAGINTVYTNNMVYNTIFQHSNSKIVINKAVAYMKVICDAHPEEADYLDTYANLLYKRGEKEKAMVFEQKASSLGNGENKEILSNLERMRNGQPTWEVY